MSTYALAELAEVAGIPTRTIRYYQDMGLLPRVQRVGRSAQYGISHLQRLRQIAELQLSGLKLSAIQEVVSGAGRGTSPVVSLMGAGPSGEVWLSEATRTFTVVELAEFLGDSYFDLLKPLEEAGFLERRSDPEGATVWYCADLPLLRGALEMAATGANVAFSGRARDLIRDRLRGLADELGEMWEAEIIEVSTDETTTDVEGLAERVRVVAWQTVAYLMAQEVDGSVREALERRVTPPS